MSMLTKLMSDLKNCEETEFSGTYLGDWNLLYSATLFTFPFYKLHQNKDRKKTVAIPTEIFPSVYSYIYYIDMYI